jgi:hypothetical protein
MATLAPMTPKNEMLNWRRDTIGNRLIEAFVSGWLGTSISQYGAIPDADSDSRLGQLLRLHELKYPTADTRFPNNLIAHGHTTHQGRFIYGQPVPALMAWKGDVGTRAWFGRGGSGTYQSAGQRRWEQFTGITSSWFWVYSTKDTDEYTWYIETRDAFGAVTSKTPVGSFKGTSGSAKQWRGHKFSNLNPNQTYYLVVEFVKGANLVFDGGDELRGTESKAFRFINMHKSGSSARGFAGQGEIGGVGIPFLNVHMMSDDEVSGLHELNISMGTNEQNSATFAADLITIIDWVRVRNKRCRIWLHLEGQPQGCSEATWRYMKDQHDYVASVRENVAVTPTSSLFTEGGIPQWTAGGYGSEFMYGPLHPNPDGYARYAAVDFANLTGSAVVVPDPEDETPGDDTVAPIVTIIDPTEGAVLGTTALFNAKVTDAGTGVAKVTLNIAGTSQVIDTLTRKSGTAADGVYTLSIARSILESKAPTGALSIRATDVQGNYRDKPFGVSYGQTTVPGEPATKLVNILVDNFNRTGELKGSSPQTGSGVWVGEAGQYTLQGAVVEPVFKANGSTVANRFNEMGVATNEDAGVGLNGQWDTSLRLSTAPGTGNGADGQPKNWRTQVIFIDSYVLNKRGRVFLDVSCTATSVNAGLYIQNGQTQVITKVVDLPDILVNGKSDQYLVVRMVITGTAVQVTVNNVVFQGTISQEFIDLISQAKWSMYFSNDNARFRMDYLTGAVAQAVATTPTDDTTGPTVTVVRPAPGATVAYGEPQDFVFKVTDASGVGASRLVVAQPSGTAIGKGTPNHLTELGEEYYGFLGIPWADLAPLAVNNVLRWTAAFRDASDANNGLGNRTEVGGFNLTITPPPTGTTPTPEITYGDLTFIPFTEFAANEVTRDIFMTIYHPQGIEYAAVYAAGSGQALRVATWVRHGTTNMWKATLKIADLKSSNRLFSTLSAFKAPNDATVKTMKTTEVPFTFATGVDSTAPVGTTSFPADGQLITVETVNWRASITDADSGCVYARVLVGVDTEVLELSLLSGTGNDGIWGASIPTDDLRLVAPKGISLRLEMTDAAGNRREGPHMTVLYPTVEQEAGFALVFAETFRFADPTTEAAFQKRVGTEGGGGTAPGSMWAVDTDGVIYLADPTVTDSLFGIDTDGNPYSKI